MSGASKASAKECRILAFGSHVGLSESESVPILGIARFVMGNALLRPRRLQRRAVRIKNRYWAAIKGGRVKGV